MSLASSFSIDLPGLALSSRLATDRVLAIKQRLIARYLKSGVSIALIREAIASAEAKAWLTGFPHLFLPDLADEILDQLLQGHRPAHHEFAEAA